MKKTSHILKSSYWCFALINNRPAEIYFHKKREDSIIDGHCYVKIEEFNTKQEQQQIKKDTSKFRFSYRQGEYRKLGSPL